jgi:hypothetical protein
VTPIVGFIAFTASGAYPDGHSFSMRYRLEFAWINNRWVFTRIRNDETGKDFTNLSGGKVILDADPMRAFLAPYRTPPKTSPTP